MFPLCENCSKVTFVAIRIIRIIRRLVYLFYGIISAMDPNNSGSDHGIEELKKKLYDRDSGDFKVRRSDLSPVYGEVNKTWKDPESAKTVSLPKKRGDIWLKILAFSFLFFIAALGVAWYMFVQDKNVISDKNIEMAVKGPVSMKAGDELTLQIAFTNKNSIAIEQAELITAFPSGAKVSTTTVSSQTNVDRQFIGNIKAGETVNVSAKALVFGQQNDELEVKMNLSYHLAGSNTLFEKETSYRFKINASPVNMEVSVPSEINSNQELRLDFRIAGNSDKVLSNVMLEVSYPPGFQFKGANIPPTFDSSKWILGDLEPGVERTITVRGVLEGQSEELKSFQIRSGIQDKEREQSIAVLYNDIFKTVTIKKPFLGIGIYKQNSSDANNFILDGEERGTYVLKWINNLPVKMQDVQIAVKLSGDVDKNNVSANGGYYSSLNNVLTWDKNTTPALRLVDLGEGGEVSFSVASLPLVSGSNILRNPQMDLEVKITGTRVSEGFAGEKVQTDLSRTVKIASEVKLSTKTFFREGPFTNTGSVPPQAEKPTTYTVSWSLNNSSNDVKNAVLETTLPLGVDWQGMTSPAGEDVSYESENRRVTWNVGYLKAGTGIALEKRAVNFQVSITPSLSQLGGSPNLTGPVKFHGSDVFTGSTIDFDRDGQTTKLDDAGSRMADGNVVR